MTRKHVYRHDDKEIVLTLSDSESVWIQFFNQLASEDFLAPLHVVLPYLAFLYELDVALPATPYGSLYYDVGIEMAADDRYPALKAAVSSGFFDRGLSMLAAEANATIDSCRTYALAYLTALEHGYVEVDI